MTLDYIFRLMLCSRKDVSANSLCLNVLEDIKQFYLIMWFEKSRLEIPFKGDNVKALIQMSKIVKTCSFISLRKFGKLQHFAMLFWFSVTKRSLENGFRFPK